MVAFRRELFSDMTQHDYGKSIERFTSLNVKNELIKRLE